MSIPLYQVPISIAGDIFTWHSHVNTVIPSSDFHCRQYFHVTFPCQYGYTKFWFPLQAIFSRDIPMSAGCTELEPRLWVLHQVLISIAGDIFTRHSRVSYTKFWFPLQAIFSRDIPVSVWLYQVLISITGDIFTWHSCVSTVLPSSDFHCRRYFHATFPCQYGYTKFWFPLQAIFSRDIPVSAGRTQPEPRLWVLHQVQLH